MKSLVILVALAGTLMTLTLGCGADYGERGRARRYEPRSERHEEHRDR